MVVLRFFEIRVHGLSVDLRGRCGIVFALYASFDLERVYPGFYELGDVFYHAEIARTEYVSSPVILFNGKRHVGALFLYYGIAPAARLRTGSSVGSAAREVVREKASSGI